MIIFCILGFSIIFIALIIWIFGREEEDFKIDGKFDRKEDKESQTLKCSLNIKTGMIRVRFDYGTYNQSFDYTCVKSGSYENYIKCMVVKFDDEDTFVI